MQITTPLHNLSGRSQKMEDELFREIDENEHDRKMIWTREKRDMPLADCNISKEYYFVFYDQMHTTGMDIKNPNESSCSTHTWKRHVLA